MGNCLTQDGTTRLDACIQTDQSSFNSFTVGTQTSSLLTAEQKPALRRTVGSTKEGSRQESTRSFFSDDSLGSSTRQNVMEVVIKACTEPRQMTEQEWRQVLTARQYHITREKGTERAFASRHATNNRSGLFLCVCCQTPLFDSENKLVIPGFGWPAFSEAGENVVEIRDKSLGLTRNELKCIRCDAHLGHALLDDPVCVRYCVNGGSLKFSEDYVRQI